MNYLYVFTQTLHHELDGIQGQFLSNDLPVLIVSFPSLKQVAVPC